MDTGGPKHQSLDFTGLRDNNVNSPGGLSGGFSSATESPRSPPGRDFLDSFYADPNNQRRIWEPFDADVFDMDRLDISGRSTSDEDSSGSSGGYRVSTATRPTNLNLEETDTFPGQPAGNNSNAGYFERAVLPRFANPFSRRPPTADEYFVSRGTHPEEFNGGILNDPRQRQRQRQLTPIPLEVTNQQHSDLNSGPISTSSRLLHGIQRPRAESLSQTIPAQLGPVPRPIYTRPPPRNPMVVPAPPVFHGFIPQPAFNMYHSRGEYPVVVNPAAAQGLNWNNYMAYSKTSTHLSFSIVGFYLEIKHTGGYIYPGPEYFDIKVFYPDGSLCRVTTQIDELNCSRYHCCFTAGEPGVYTAQIKLGHHQDAHHIDGSPLTFCITRNYLNHRVDTIVGMGMRPPTFGRRQLHPRDDTNSAVKQWGIDVDRFENRIFVADKENNQIRVFSEEGDLLNIIGKSNAMMGEESFYRPTGVAVDNLNKRLIITDKDNHRVCITSLQGQFIRSFGSEGHENGQFNFPWGVAVSPSGNLIAVADSRNHRVQLFDRTGCFLRKFSIFETQPFEYKKELDYPRGICFDNTGKTIYVSDFNIHIVISLDIELTKKKVIVPPGHMTRPQGLCVDAAGNVLVCDSRRNFIRVINPQGDMLCNVAGNGPQITFPLDISILRGGRLAIIDGKGSIRLY